MRIFLVTLGCPKNEVDSAGMAVLLEEAGHILVEEPVQADVLIVNTCGFIRPAREESLGVIAELARKKRRRQVLIAAGCMAGLYAAELEALPGVDALLPTERWDEITDMVARLTGAGPTAPPDVPLVAGLSAVNGGSAYLKIADGCSAHCAFAPFPRSRGLTTASPRPRCSPRPAALWLRASRRSSWWPRTRPFMDVTGAKKRGWPA